MQVEDIEIEEIQNQNDNIELTFFNELPEEIIIKILSYLSPYTDTKTAKLVNRKWSRLITAIEYHCRRMYLDALSSCSIMWKIRKQRSYDITETLLPDARGGSIFKTKVQRPSFNVPCPRFSHSSVILGQYLYVFGGSSSESNTSSTFNDLYRLDLSTHIWQKVPAEGLLPAPRECCTMVAYKQKPNQHLYKTVPYKGKLIVFGGWCQPPPDRIIIGPRFFDDTQIFHSQELRWQRVQVDDIYPTARAGHSASITGNKMVLFGGSQRNSRLNDVWIFDIDSLSWTCPYVRCAKPRERFGHCQFSLNDRMVMVLGGCGGPHELLGDAWLFDVTLHHWTQLKIENSLHEPPDLWCHASVLVKGDVIVFSEEKKCPFCRSPIQDHTIPVRKPAGDAAECSCGRRNPEQMIQFTQPRLQMYVLDCSSLLTNSICRWTSYRYLSPSPPSRRLFTANVGINEILIFGGLQNYITQESKIDDCTIVVSAKPI